MPMYNDAVKLISERIENDENDNQIAVRTERTVFAELYSVGSAEFYQASIAGMKPNAKFKIADYLDYKGETLLAHTEYGSDTERLYEIIRTYRVGNELELTCQEKVGVR